MTLGIYALNSNVIVRLREEEADKTSGGIVLPRTNLLRGEIISSGPNCSQDSVEGDIVVFDIAHARSVHECGEVYWIVPESSLLYFLGERSNDD